MIMENQLAIALPIFSQLLFLQTTMLLEFTTPVYLALPDMISSYNQICCQTYFVPRSSLIPLIEVPDLVMATKFVEFYTITDIEMYRRGIVIIFIYFRGMQSRLAIAIRAQWLFVIYYCKVALILIVSNILLKIVLARKCDVWSISLYNITVRVEVELHRLHDHWDSYIQVQYKRSKLPTYLSNK